MAQLFVNQLTVIDFSYLHSTRGLVGESWRVDIILHGGLDEQGMVLDFGQVKQLIKQTIDHHFDHKLLVAADYTGLIQQTNEQALALIFELQTGARIQHTSPPEAVTFIPGTEILPENTAQAIIQTLMPHMPANVSQLELQLMPETITEAYYHYSHGLKHHEGNCQRIAHGHRSRLHIERNGQREQNLEQIWAEKWCDIYIGSREDLLSANNDDFIFGYTSTQGLFRLQLPQQNCYLIDADSTVENIAQHIADELHQQHPQDKFKVLAFEGINKGAIGIA